MLIGRRGKGCGFLTLEGEVVDKHCRGVVLIGRDAAAIEQVLSPGKCVNAASLDEAIHKAQNLALAGRHGFVVPGLCKF